MSPSSTNPPWLQALKNTKKCHMVWSQLNLLHAFKKSLELPSPSHSLQTKIAEVHDTKFFLWSSIYWKNLLTLAIWIHTWQCVYQRHWSLFSQHNRELIDILWNLIYPIFAIAKIIFSRFHTINFKSDILSVTMQWSLISICQGVYCISFTIFCFIAKWI